MNISPTYLKSLKNKCHFYIQRKYKEKNLNLSTITTFSSPSLSVVLLPETFLAMFVLMRQSSWTSHHIRPYLRLMCACTVIQQKYSCCKVTVRVWFNNNKWFCTFIKNFILQCHVTSHVWHGGSAQMRDGYLSKQEGRGMPENIGQYHLSEGLV